MLIYVNFYVNIIYFFKVMKLNINLKPEQLRQLSEDINRTLSQPMNIDDIIKDTHEDLLEAKMLNEEAEKKQ